jgi:hypothetical protein
MKDFLKSMLKDSVDGSWSSKRIVTLLAFILCSVAFIANTFWGKTVSTELFDSMMYIVVAGLGFTASEKFANNK